METKAFTMRQSNDQLKQGFPVFSPMQGGSIGKLTRVDRMGEFAPLAWLVEQSSSLTRVVCGNDVEVGDSYLVEGCWDGPFVAANFLEAENFFGTGFRLLPDGIQFGTATQMLDYLYVLLQNADRVVSNSLPLLLAYANVTLDPRCNYVEPLVTIIEGVRGYERNITETHCGRIVRLARTNFALTADGVQEIAKRECPRFADFEAYKSYLVRSLSACLTNASDPQRIRKYSPLVSCSSGYDSNACAVIAASVGCTRAVTLRTARDGGPDSGARVARALGLDCVEYDRPSRATEAESEMEFFASGVGTGGDYVIRAFENEIRRAVFLTGFYGGPVWSKSVAPSRDLIRSDDSGTGLTEFRLRTGFFHVDVPFIGAMQAEDIWRITNSPELASYSLTVSYNKPIARRLIEEAGVPREWFGQVKRAVAIGFVWDAGLLHAESREDFSNFVKARGLRLRLLGDRLFSPLGKGCWRLIRKAEKADQLLFGGRLGIAGMTVTRLTKRWLRPYAYSASTYANLLFLWGIERSIQRYKGAITMGAQDT